MVLVYVILAVAVVVVLWVVLSRRLRDGDAVAGGSLGRQLGRKEDDWGPKS